MKTVRVVGNDFKVTINVDAERNDERGEWTVPADSEVSELMGMIISIGIDDKGIVMSEDSASINGIVKAMRSHDYEVFFDEEEVTPDLDGEDDI